jgi:transposase
VQIEHLFSQALGVIAPWKITSVEFIADQKRLNIYVDFTKGALFDYEDETTGEIKQYKAHDTREQTWRHLNFFEHECYLVVRTPRIKPDSGGIKMVMPPWSGVVCGFTLLFEALILQMSSHMPVHKVAETLNIYDKKIWHLFDCYVCKGLFAHDHVLVKMLGIDETSVKRGHDYISLFVDLMRKRTIHISDGKGHETVTDFATNFVDSNGVRENITDVSCDMSPAFIKGVRKEFPQAAITFDKFHILKIINEAVDRVRKEEAKTTPALKGARYAILKNAQNLTKKQKEQRESLSQMNLKTTRALRIRESFQDIYKATTTEQFKELLQEWYYWATHSRLEPLKKAAKTIKKHWDGVVRWKESQINNGILEGLNSVIQAAKRKARGYGKNHFKTMVFLLTGKLDLKKFNPYLPTCFS